MGMLPVLSPMANKNELYSNEQMLSPEESADIQSKIGTLQYCAKETRYDIAAAVNMIAQKMSESTVGVRKAISRVLAYLVYSES